MAADLSHLGFHAAEPMSFGRPVAVRRAALGVAS
jgi:hypothetical protein